ncbi:monocarboxylate transporter 12-like isoform X2 [Acanthaster planci]|nr:monocarboxylate transporter 12-like isoform X2 [Acanthaster planci]
MLGAAVTGLGTILGSVSSNIDQLYICNGLTGVGTVMTVSPGMIMISHSFKKRYVFANGLAVLGLNVGQMVFPPLIRLLIVSYGWRGAMFIIGALQLNGVAACALFRPMKSILKDVPRDDERRRPCIKRNKCGDGTLRQHVKYLSIFSNIRAMLVLVAVCAYSMALIVNLFHLPERSKEAGWSHDLSAMLVFVYGLISAVTRSTHGWLVDRNYIGPFKLQLIVILGATLISFLNPVSDSYTFLVFYTLVLGAFLGVSSPLLIVNMKNVASPAQVPSAICLTWASFYLFSGVGSVLAGTIYDATGNYLAPFLTSGTLFLLAFLLFAVVTVMKSRQDKRLKLHVDTTSTAVYHVATEDIGQDTA